MRGRLSGDVQLVSRAPLERVPRVCPDLGRDAEGAQQAEGSAGDRRVADVEMDRHLAAALQMHASRGVKQPRELGESVALAARRDRRELVPEILRE